MELSRGFRWSIGVLSCWPTVYLIAFFGFAFYSTASGVHSISDSGVLPLVHIGTIILTFVLAAFYVLFLFRTHRVPNDKKALWAAVLLLGAMVSMPVFWYFYVRPTNDG
jgi:hypothetical protein